MYAKITQAINMTNVIVRSYSIIIKKEEFMQKTMTTVSEIKLVGIKCRTNNTTEQDPNNAKIGATVQKFFQDAVTEKILNRVTPNTTYCAYSEYSSDHNADYSFFIGEAVSEFPDDSDEMVQLTIPAQKYIKFTNGPGAMPDVCINVWQKIWQMTDKDFGGARSYITDFEVYDARAIDRENTVLDVYVGIN